MTRLAAVILAWIAAGTALANPFQFVALGDTAYNLPKDYSVYRALIQTINAANPAFSIHVGDTWGALECSEKAHQKVRGFFDQFDHPVIYTPGDNEWVDCLKPEHVEFATRYLAGEATAQDLATLADGLSLDGGYQRKLSADGFSSLASLRRTFFATNKSLGSDPITLTRQADVSEFDDMVENAIWEHEQVVFGTVHVPGSGNNFFINNQERALEAIARNRANIEWLKQMFAQAQANDAKAVVIALHAALFQHRQDGRFTGLETRGGANGPFHWMVLAIRDLGAKFGRPVLVIHGDFHEFEIDRPFLVSGGEAAAPKYANITRLQVYGAPELKAVRVSVEPETPWVFSFSPLHN